MRSERMNTIQQLETGLIGPRKAKVEELSACSKQEKCQEDAVSLQGRTRSAFFEGPQQYYFLDLPGVIFFRANAKVLTLVARPEKEPKCGLFSSVARRIDSSWHPETLGQVGFG